MLDLIFYGVQGEDPQYIQLSESFYEWLARSEFSKIGGSESVRLNLEGEVVDLPLVKLELKTRDRLANFFRDQIVVETERILVQLDELFSKDVYQEVTYRLRKLQELRKSVENQNYLYLQRV